MVLVGPPKSVDERWLRLHDAMKMVGKVNSGFKQHLSYDVWVSTGSLKFFEVHHSIPGNGDFSDKRGFLRQNVVWSLRAGRETWWSECTIELETAAAFGKL